MYKAFIYESNVYDIYSSPSGEREIVGVQSEGDSFAELIANASFGTDIGQGHDVGWHELECLSEYQYALYIRDIADWYCEQLELADLLRSKMLACLESLTPTGVTLNDVRSFKDREIIAALRKAKIMFARDDSPVSATPLEDYLALLMRENEITKETL